MRKCKNTINGYKKLDISFFEKKIDLISPIYISRKMNINNTQDISSPENNNFPTGQKNVNFLKKHKISIESVKKFYINSIEDNKNKEKNKQNLNKTKNGMISEAFSGRLTKRNDSKNIENIFLGKNKGVKNNNNTNENKENFRQNYNMKNNNFICNNNINNSESNNVYIDNFLINNNIYNSNNFYYSIYNKNYIKKKIIPYNNRKKNIYNSLNLTKNSKDLNINDNKTQKIRKKTNNFELCENDNNNCLNSRIIYNYKSNNNYLKYTKNLNNAKKDISFIGNLFSTQKRKVSNNNFTNTPDYSKYINNSKLKVNEVRKRNSCYLENILSFRKENPKVIYKSPSSRYSKIYLLNNKTKRDISGNKSINDYNFNKREYIANINNIKYPSSRHSTFNKLSFKNGINNINNQNSFFSLNYTCTEINENMSMDSKNKKVFRKKKKPNKKVHKAYIHMKINKDKLLKKSKIGKEYLNNYNKNKKNIDKVLKTDNKINNKHKSNIFKYKCEEKDNKLNYRTMSDLNNKSKGDYLIDSDDISIKTINNKEKKLNKSNSTLYNKNLLNFENIYMLNKYKRKNITPKKKVNKQANKGKNNIIKNYSSDLENKDEKKEDKNFSISDKNKKIYNNAFSNATTNHKYNSNNMSYTSSTSSFIINDELKNINSNINNINDRLNSNIMEFENKENIINLDILYILESKLKSLLIKINNYQICYNECNDWISYFIGNNFYDKLTYLFNSGQNKKQAIYYSKFELICYFMCYDISFNKNYSQASILLKTIFNLLHKNYLSLITYIIKKITEKIESKEKEYINNNNYIEQMIIIKKLHEVIKNELKMNLGIQDVNDIVILQIFSDNFKQISNYYEMIIENIYSNIQEYKTFDKENNKFNLLINKNNNFCQFPECLKINILKMNDKKKSFIISEFFKNALKSIELYNIKDLLLFFDLYLNKSTDNLFIQKYLINKKILSVIPKTQSSQTNNQNKILPPINSEKYTYTLILDLDETLIYYEKEHYIFNNMLNIKNKKLTLRPGIFNFLNRMKKIYELILFTFSSPEYANPIINLIEKDGIYFEHKLYIEHASYYNGEYVKNINDIGREIKNTIIIEDNINNICKSNIDNTICIKPFYGDIDNEKNTLQLLGNVLNKIRYDAEITGDITNSLKKEKYSIITEISSNLEE